MLELGLLGHRRRAGQGLQALVYLQRVGRHGDRVLAAQAQERCQLDRHGCLADPRRTEQRDDPHGDRLTVRADLRLHRPADRRHRRHRACDCPHPLGARREPHPDGSPQRRARAAGSGVLGPRDRRRPGRAGRGAAAGPGGRGARHPRRQRRAARLGPAGLLLRHRDRPRAGRQPAGADRAGARARARDGLEGSRPPRVHVLPGRQGGHPGNRPLQRDQVRPARLRLRAARRSAHQRGRRLSRVPRLHPRRRDVRRSGSRAAHGRRDTYSRGCGPGCRLGDRGQPRRGRCRPHPPAPEHRLRRPRAGVAGRVARRMGSRRSPAAWRPGSARSAERPPAQNSDCCAGASTPSRWPVPSASPRRPRQNAPGAPPRRTIRARRSRSGWGA